MIDSESIPGVVGVVAHGVVVAVGVTVGVGVTGGTVGCIPV